MVRLLGIPAALASSAAIFMGVGTIGPETTLARPVAEAAFGDDARPILLARMTVTATALPAQERLASKVTD